MGKAIIKPNKNNHFSRCTVVYFADNDFTKTKYIPKNDALITKSAFPKGILGASRRISFPKTIKTKAPIKPNITPTILGSNSRSFMRIAENTNTNMGVMVMSTALLMGVESSIPLKKQSMFITIPKSAQSSIFGKSARSIFCCGIKRLTSQNKLAAPKRRTCTKPKP